MKPRFFVTTNVDAETAARLQRDADEHKMPLSPLVRDIIRQHYERQDQKQTPIQREKSS